MQAPVASVQCPETGAWDGATRLETGGCGRGRGKGPDLRHVLLEVSITCMCVCFFGEERFARLVNATLEDLGQRPPGRLFIGSCGDAVQWAGYRHELSMDSLWWAVGHHRSAESSVQ